MVQDSLNETIRNWLEKEDYAVAEKEEPMSEFHLVISNFHGKGTIADIVKLRHRDFVIIGSALQNPPEFMKILSAVEEKDRAEFFNNVQRDLLKFRVDHEFHPDKLLPERMIIRDVVYEEDITRSGFMEHLKRVKFASLFLLWSVGHRFSVGAAQSTTPHYLSTNSNTPYG